MQYRTLGNTGLKVSEIGFGGEWMDGTFEQALAVVKACEAAGINILDCWMPDPTRRSNLGDALQQLGSRDRWIIQGHLGSTWQNGQYVRTRDLDQVKPAFEDLLARFHTDYMDLGMIHYVDKPEEYRAIMADSPFIRYIRELRAAGTVRHVGLSTHNPEVAKLAALEPVVISDTPARAALGQSTAPAAVVRAALGAAVPPPVASCAPAREQPLSGSAPLPPASGWFSAGPASYPAGVPKKPEAAPAALSREPAAPAQAGSPAAGPALPPLPDMEQQTLAPQPVAGEAGLRLVGVVFDTYWIFECGDRLLRLDQHAAHERMLYDRLMERFEKGTVSQQLLSPQLVRLTAHDMALVSEFAPVLADAGFEVEPFDDTCVAVKAVPTLFGENESPRELLLEALDEWQAGRGQVTRERMRRRVAQMACKHAIKGGDHLNETQVSGFLREILRSDSMPTCPHGRPIVTEITRYALEKRFKRVQ